MEIVIHEGCASEHAARQVAIEIQQEFSDWTISLRQLGIGRAASLGVIAVPIQNLMAKLTPDQTQDVKRRIIQVATQHRRGDKITVPIAVRIVAARKPV